MVLLKWTVLFLVFFLNACSTYLFVIKTGVFLHHFLVNIYLIQPASRQKIFWVDFCQFFIAIILFQ